MKKEEIMNNAVDKILTIAKCQCILNIFLKKLRIIFRERYEFEHGHPYDLNNNPNVAEFFNNIKKEKILKTDAIGEISPSNIDCWNIGILIFYLTTVVPKKIEYIEKFEKENKILEKLMVLMELTQSSLIPPKMSQVLKSYKRLYKDFCELNGEVADSYQLSLLLDSNHDDLKTKLIPGYIINQELENQCLKLKIIGNEYFKKKEYLKALESYTNAIKLLELNRKEVSNKTMAILLLNIATTKFELYKIKNEKLKERILSSSSNDSHHSLIKQISTEYDIDFNLYDCLNDAFTATTYYPTWSKIYYRISQFKHKTSKFEKDIYESTIYAKCALYLEPTNTILNDHVIKVQKALQSIDTNKNKKQTIAISFF